MGGRSSVAGLRAVAAALVLAAPLAGAAFAVEGLAPLPDRPPRPSLPSGPERNPSRAAPNANQDDAQASAGNEAPSLVTSAADVDPSITSAVGSPSGVKGEDAAATPAPDDAPADPMASHSVEIALDELPPAPVVAVEADPPEDVVPELDSFERSRTADAQPVEIDVAAPPAPPVVTAEVAPPEEATPQEAESVETQVKVDAKPVEMDIDPPPPLPPVPPPVVADAAPADEVASLIAETAEAPTNVETEAPADPDVSTPPQQASAPSGEVASLDAQSADAPASAETEMPAESAVEMPPLPPAETATPAQDTPQDTPQEPPQDAESLDAAPDDSPETPDDTMAAPGEEETDPTLAEPAIPAPPPAHPVVAVVRAELEAGQGASGSDLEALKAFYGERTDPPLWVTDAGFSPKAKAAIDEINKAEDWGLPAGAYDPPSASDPLTTPEAQAAAEIKLSVAVLKYARFAQGGRFTPAKIHQLFDQRPSIRDSGTVLKQISEASEAGAYLTSLHPSHQQFKRLREALLRARANAQQAGRRPIDDRNVQLILMNMERWRWMPRELGSYYVWNNVPEFNTRVVKNGKTIYVEKTIVGQLKYATPFFSAPMRSIVFHPSWTVPSTILREDLAPNLQRGGFFGGSSTAILRQHNLSVSYKGQPVDADTVDWPNVNIRAYTFTQPPGPANVLGKLKFNFPNKHAIYMHDTPQRELFRQTVRTLSHGCIRVHQPDRLAALLLAEDKGWPAGRVQSLLAANDNYTVNLNRSIPVHLTYFTAVAGENGGLQTLTDIYGLDASMAPAMFARPAGFQAPPPPQVSEAAPPRERRVRRQTGTFVDSIGGLFGN